VSLPQPYVCYEFDGHKSEVDHGINRITAIALRDMLGDLRGERAFTISNLTPITHGCPIHPCDLVWMSNRGNHQLRSFLSHWFHLRTPRQPGKGMGKPRPQTTNSRVGPDPSKGHLQTVSWTRPSLRADVSQEHRTRRLLRHPPPMREKRGDRASPDQQLI